MSRPLIQLIEQIREGLREGTYRNEESVRLQIVMPILGHLGWDQANSRLVKPEYRVGKRRADVALFLPKHQSPCVLLELKSVGRADEGLDQLLQYCVSEGADLGIVTDGASWRFHLPFGKAKHSKEREIHRVDLNDPGMAEKFLKRYLDFDRLKSGQALVDAKQDYHDNVRFHEVSEEIPGLLNKVIIENPNSDLVNALVREYKLLNGYQPSPDVVREILRNLKPPHWTTRGVAPSPPSPVSPPSPRVSQSPSVSPSPSVSKYDGYRIVVGNFEKEYLRAVDALEAFLNAAERACGRDFLKELAPLCKGPRRQLLAPTRDEIAERNSTAWQESKQLECGWWLCRNTSTSSKDIMANKAMEIARRLHPGLDIKWQRLDSKIRPESSGTSSITPPTPPTTTDPRPSTRGPVRVRIVVGDTQGEYATGADALIALLNAAWRIFGQGAFEALAQETRGTTRQLVARSQNEIGLPGSYARESARQLESGWWLCVNTSQVDKTRIANKLRAITSRTHPQVTVKWIDLK